MRTEAEIRSPVVSAPPWRMAFYENLYQTILQGGAETTGDLISASIRIVLALVLIGLALALVKKGYDNISTVRDRTGGRAVEPGDD